MSRDALAPTTVHEDGHLNLAASPGAEGTSARQVRRLLRDRAPTTREQSSKFVDWSTLGRQLGQPFDNTSIPMSKLEQMRRDPMIAFGLMFCKVPLVRAQWFVKCADPAKAAFLDAELRKVWGRFVLSMTNDFDYGHSPVVKRFQLDKPQTTYIDKSEGAPRELKAWDNDVDAIVWKPFVPLNPRECEPAFNTKGEFNGIWIRKPNKTLKSSDEVPDIPLEYALWSTNEKDSVFGSLYGYPRTGYAYRFWWSYWYRWALADRAFERYADPAIKVYHPPRQYDEENNEVDFSDTALRIGEEVRSGATVAIPNTLLAGPDESKPSSLRSWEIQQMDGSANFEALRESFEYLDVQKLRSLMVPEQALIEGKGGTSSRNVAATFGDAFQESMAVKMAEIVDHANRFVINQLGDLNFGADSPRAEVVSKGFDPIDVDTMREIIRLNAQTDPKSLQADLRAMMDRLGMPTLSVEEVRKQLEKAAEAAADRLPPVVDEEGTAGVDEEGLYYTPREVINLAQFPFTRQYTDPTIRGLGDELGEMWKFELAAMYESFAKFVEKQDGLDLAQEEEKHPGAANRLVARWRYSPSRTGKVRDLSSKIINNIVRLAADRELRSFGLSGDNWNMDNPEVRSWIEQRGAKLVRKVSDTVRDELRKFLAVELGKDQSPVGIAQAVRQHFAEFPGWKSNRIARTEVRDAYNAASLLSYRSAGVDMVQAFDGSGGLTGETDAECVARNGQVMTLDEALAIDEHPNGTLGWRPLMTTNFSIEVVPQVELPGEGDTTAYWEAATGTMYLAEGLSDREQREQLLLVGDILSRSESA